MRKKEIGKVGREHPWRRFGRCWDDERDEATNRLIVARKELTMVDHEEMEEDEFEGQIEQMIVENGMLIQALMNLLLGKGVITEDEMDQELEKLYKELGEDMDDDDGE
jgi:hypothetical protein